MLKKELEAKRKVYLKIKLEEQKQKRIFEEKNKKFLEKKEKKFKQHATTIKAKVEIFNILREKNLKKIEEKMKIEKILKAKKLQEDIKNKLPIVRRRQIDADVRVMIQYQKKIQKEKEKVYQNERIKEAIKKYSFVPKIKPSFTRLKGYTRSTVNRMDAKTFKPIFSNPGYEDEHLLKDMRFKL